MKTAILILACAGLLGLHLAASKGNPVGLIEDDSVQVLLARSLSRGSFALPDENGAAVSDPLPGLAAILAAPVRLLEPRWGGLRGVSLLAMALVALFTWRIGRRLLPGPWPAVAAALTALSPVFVRHAGLVLPDIPYLALTLMALDFGTLGGAQAGGSRTRLAAGVLAAGLAALVRPHGALLCLALAVGFLASAGSRRRGLLFLASLAPLGLWLLRNKLAAGVSTGYAVNWRGQVALLGEPGAQVSHGLSLVSSFFGFGLAGLSRPSWLVLTAGACLLLCAGWGLVRLLKERRTQEPLLFAMAAYSIMVLVLHMTWSPEDSRYAIPLAPLVWIFAAAAAGSAAPPRAALSAAFLLGFLALTACWKDFDLARASLARPSSYQSRTMAWIRSNTPPGALIESLKFNTVMLLTGRPCLPPPLSLEGPQQWTEASRKAGVSFVHVEHLFRPGGFVPPGVMDVGRRINGWASSLPEGALVFRDDAEGASVFRLAIPAAGAPGLGVCPTNSARFGQAISSRGKAREPRIPVGI
jgi:hypothetical protein